MRLAVQFKYLVKIDHLEDLDINALLEVGRYMPVYQT
jgi:hypothetical protein